MYSAFLQDDPVAPPPVAPVPEAVAQTAIAPAPPAKPTYWPGQRKFGPRRFHRSTQEAEQPQPQPQPQQLQFYDHQMAMAAQQNLRNQQLQQRPTAEPSGIGGISWPVIALAGGGFLMLMMVMMSGKK